VCVSCLGGCHDALATSDMLTGKYIDRVSTQKYTILGFSVKA